MNKRKWTGVSVCILIGFLIITFLYWNCELRFQSPFEDKYIFKSVSDAVQDRNGYTYLIDQGKKAVIVLDSERKLVRKLIGGNENADFFYAARVCGDDSGNIYIADLISGAQGNQIQNMIASYLPKELIQQSEDAQNDNQVSDCQKDNEKYQKYGISIEQGISYSNGDIEVYLDLVSMFLNEDSMRDKLYQYMYEENLKEYAVLVHSLKGNARTLGADRLADIAYEHEMKSKEQDLDFVKSGWNELVDVWNTSLEGFKELYHYYRSGEEDKYRLVSARDSEILELTESDLSKVVALIDDFETDKAVEQLKIWINSPLKPDVHERIKNALIALEDEFDEDKAMLLLSK